MLGVMQAGQPMFDGSDFVGAPGDFDFLVGRWRVHNRKLRHRLVGSDAWDDIHADYEAWTHLDGVVSVDEFRFLETGTSASSIRTLDRAHQRWSIYWVTNTDGVLGAPVSGGWRGATGEFYGHDLADGQHVTVRFLWSRHGSDAARWEQAFQLRGRSTWETNWVMDFQRVGR